METLEQLREEFAQWLSNETWNWTTYATLTFSRPTRKDALRFALVWARFIARTAPRLWGFCFQEAHSDGQRLHVHCLLSVQKNLLGEPSNREMWSWWFQKFGRAQVVDFRRPSTQLTGEMTNLLDTPKNHAIICEEYITPLASYLTKYMVKETFCDSFDWDFFAFADGFQLTSDEFHRYQGVNPTFVPFRGPPNGVF